jgi:ArsR family transcriptional regulator
LEEGEVKEGTYGKGSVAPRNFIPYIYASIYIDMNTILSSLKAVADDHRCRIVMLLADQEACVCELMPVFGMTQSKLSHHLIVLRDAGFLRAEKRGKWNYYKVDHRSLGRERTELLSCLAGSLVNDPSVNRDRKKLAAVRQRMNICC